ncbi:hypothetical protein H8E88_04805 [candidate division KSB1 bacterium]|nr:hypothetical protein [candidate division KSB1 bacterium]
MEKNIIGDDGDINKGSEMDPKFLLFIQKHSNFISTYDEKGQKNIGADWNNTVFAQFNNPELKSALQKWANENSCFISWGNDPPDIIAFPFFVSIIDRNLLGSEGWEHYLEFIERVNDGQPIISDDENIEIKDDSICIIVDNIRNMKLPKLDTVVYFDLSDKESIPSIIKTIATEKIYLNKKNGC